MKMKARNKILLLALCMAALIAVSVIGTMAYLTSTKTVTNTFTVGKVAIKLDETKVNTDGSAVTGEAGGRKEEGNTYKLLPGHKYTKDPMVTVIKGSEKSYIKMTVAISESSALDKIFSPDGAKLMEIFTGYDSENWEYKGNTVKDDVRTYEFWYKEAVGAPTDDVALDALFDSITVPGTITGEQLETIEGMTITVNAYAIQADGFANADAAWAAANFN